MGMLALKISKDFHGTMPDDLGDISGIDCAKRILGSLKLNQDLDLIQRTKEKGEVDIVDFSVNDLVRATNGADFEISNVKKASLARIGYDMMSSHLAGGPVGAQEPDPARTVCMASENWLDNLMDQAKRLDENILRDDGIDLHVLSRVGGVACLVLVLTLATGKLRNKVHLFFLDKFSGIRTERCHHCMRRWVPADLSYRAVAKLNEEAVERSLHSRGIALRSGSVIAEKRALLRQTVYLENISFRRPWSLLYHHHLCPVAGPRTLSVTSGGSLSLLCFTLST